MLNDAHAGIRDRLGNIDELINAAADAAERGENLAEFLDHAALVSESDALDDSRAGLAADHPQRQGTRVPVRVPRRDGGGARSRTAAPSVEDGTGAAQIEEERRLCYVAMTRAEKRLYLSWAKYRRRYGGGSPERQHPRGSWRRCRANWWSRWSEGRQRPRSRPLRRAARRAAGSARKQSIHREDVQFVREHLSVLRRTRHADASPASRRLSGPQPPLSAQAPVRSAPKPAAPVPPPARPGAARGRSRFGRRVDHQPSEIRQRDGAAA